MNCILTSDILNSNSPYLPHIGCAPVRNDLPNHRRFPMTGCGGVPNPYGFSLLYSAWAVRKIGMWGRASFQSVRKSL
jgi:hypothetical protein